MTNNILQNLINFLAPVVGIAIVVFCVVQAWKLFRGQPGASVKNLLLGVLVLPLILGIMYAAGSFEAYGNLFKGVSDEAINQVGGEAGSILK